LSPQEETIKTISDLGVHKFDHEFHLWPNVKRGLGNAAGCCHENPFSWNGTRLLALQLPSVQIHGVKPKVTKVSKMMTAIKDRLC